MSITIRDPNHDRPATYYIQVQNDLERRGISDAEMRPGAENVVWVTYGAATRPISLYYIFQKGEIRDVQLD